MSKIAKISIVFVFFLANFLFIISQTYALDCSNCAPGACYCNVDDCPTGSIDVYTSQCTGIPIKEFVFSNGNFTWLKASASNYYFQAFCDSGARSNCTNVLLSSYASNTTTNVTTTSSSTTTTVTKAACPSDCCVGNLNYYNKYCPAGYTCKNNQCTAQFVTTTATSEITTEISTLTVTDNGNTGGSQLNYSIIGIVVIVVIAAVFVFFFLKGRTTGKKEDKWGELYKKYGRPQ